ncbi:MAG: hypothetical protein ABR505_10595 [Actinomycetota bacterium]
MQTQDPDPGGLVLRSGGAQALLGEASRGDAPGQGWVEAMKAVPDLGDIVIVLLVGTLAGLRDRLVSDGFDRAADVITDLVELADDYVTQVVAS